MANRVRNREGLTPSNLITAAHAQGLASGGGVTLFWFESITDCVDMDTLQQFLSMHESAQASKIADLRRRHQVMLRWIVRRAVLALYCGVPPESVEFRTRNGGKPYAVLPTGDIVEFSSSHTANIAILAIATWGRVGVDIQSSNVILNATNGSLVVNSGISPASDGVELPKASHSRLIRHWTRLEAYLKATGQGVGSGVGHVTVPDDDVLHGVMFRPEESGPEWLIFSKTCRNNVEAALVVELSGCPPYPFAPECVWLTPADLCSLAFTR